MEKFSYIAKSNGTDLRWKQHSYILTSSQTPRMDSKETLISGTKLVYGYLDDKYTGRKGWFQTNWKMSIREFLIRYTFESGIKSVNLIKQ